jgi:hypothetical protein
MSITSGTGTSSPSEAPRFGPFLQWNSCNAIFSVHATTSIKEILLGNTSSGPSYQLRDRPFNLKGGRVMVFCFVQNFFFRTFADCAQLDVV